MCHGDVSPQAREALADMLAAIRAKLAAEAGCDPGQIIIGPVDFGTPE
jgi:hypothetical protein